MKMTIGILFLLINSQLMAQIVNGGSHEVPKEEKVRTPKHIKITKDIIKEEFPDDLGEVGLKGSPSDIKVSLEDIAKIDALYLAINNLKARDIDCSHQLGTKNIFYKEKTLEDVINKFSVAFYTDKVTNGVKTFESKKCDCDELTSKVLACIKEDLSLKNDLSKSIFNESDLKHLLDIIYMGKDVVDEKAMKQLLKDFYGESK
jgi:hypothetical protein